MSASGTRTGSGQNRRLRGKKSFGVLKNSRVLVDNAYRGFAKENFERSQHVEDALGQESIPKCVIKIRCWYKTWLKMPSDWGCG